MLAFPPVVTISPALINASKGESVEYNCLATGMHMGAADFEYQWFLNQLIIYGQNASTLIIDDVTKVDSGNYMCSVRNPCKGIGHSEVAMLLVLGMYINFQFVATVAIWVFLDQSCQSVTVDYQGFDITWNETVVGVTVKAPCTGTGLNGQSCIIICFEVASLLSLWLPCIYIYNAHTYTHAHTCTHARTRVHTHTELANS